MLINFVLSRESPNVKRLVLRVDLRSYAGPVSFLLGMSQTTLCFELLWFLNDDSGLGFRKFFEPTIVFR